ncbi:Alkaline phosphatase synthesis transcriptional regulatory protein PhoP [Thalassocella blandensis]|nr:Alkaline phosphatase synthesis transcriptional regulatory protein PhoP [Thalassocella blandensis]
MQKNILVVEDQQDISNLITLNLQNAGFHVDQCSDGRQGFARALRGDYDAIVLDIMLPELDGLSVCQQLREQQIYTPILMLTAKKSEADRVLGLEVGADDYLTKPFSVLELQARVKALLRRVDMLNKQQHEDEGESLQFGDLAIFPQKRTVIVAGQSVNLTVKEFDLLVYLANFPGEVFSRDQLLNAVWGAQHSGYEHTVNSHINRLRAKLETDPAKPKYVLTVWGVGYKFYEH